MAISLEREIPRNWRFASEEDEQKLLKPPIRIFAASSRDARYRVPSRGNAVTPVAGCEPPRRSHDSPSKGENQHGEAHPDLHPTGCDVGDAACASGWKGTPRGRTSSAIRLERVKSVRTAWDNARESAGLKGIAAARSTTRGRVSVRGGWSVSRLRQQVLGTRIWSRPPDISIPTAGASMKQCRSSRTIGRPLHNLCTTDEDAQANVPRKVTPALLNLTPTWVMSWCGREDLNLHDLAATSS